MVLTWPVQTVTTVEGTGTARRSRRELLRAAGLLVLAPAAALSAGCDLLDREPPPPDPLAPLLTEALDLAAAHEAAAAAFGDLADRLRPLAEAHRAHAAELARVTGTALPSAPATGAGTPSTAADSGAALAGLRQAEQRGRDSAVTACLAAPPRRAALVGSIAAARASHLEVLR
jgi:hypothetical protein